MTLMNKILKMRPKKIKKIIKIYKIKLKLLGNQKNNIKILTIEYD